VLEELPPEKAAPILACDRLLRTRDETVRRETIRALGWMKSPLALDVAIDSLTSRDAFLRNVACVALGRIGDKKAVSGLLGVLDEKEETGGFAAIALGRIEDPGIFPEVIARLGVGNRAAKGKALVACARPSHADRLLALLAGGSGDAKIAACAALGKIKN